MNLNASPETLRAAAKVFQLACILDDRVAQPDKLRIAAWAEQIERHKLTQPDLLDGLQAFYDGPSERAIQIGDLIHHSKIIRRARLDKEADEDRERRQDARESMAAEDVQVLAAGIAFGPTVHTTPRLRAAEDALQCVTEKADARAAIAEYLAAKSEARRRPVKVAS